MHDAHLALVSLIAPELGIEAAAARIAVTSLQIIHQFSRPMNGDFPATKLPKQKFQDSLDIEIVGCGACVARVEDAGIKTRHTPVIALDRY